jgi:hypothetical protein
VRPVDLQRQSTLTTFVSRRLPCIAGATSRSAIVVRVDEDDRCSRVVHAAAGRKGIRPAKPWTSQDPDDIETITSTSSEK